MDFFENIRFGRTEEIRKALAAKPSLVHEKDPKGFPALVLASYNNQYDVTKLLIESGAEANTEMLRETQLLWELALKAIQPLQNC